MGAYSRQPRKKINQKAQGKKQLAEGEGHITVTVYVPTLSHLVVKAKSNIATL